MKVLPDLSRSAMNKTDQLTSFKRPRQIFSRTDARKSATSTKDERRRYDGG